MADPVTPTHVNGVDPDTKALADIKAAATTSLDSISQNAFQNDLNLPLQVPTVPLGDNPNPAQPQPTPTIQAPHPADILTSLNSLESDIDGAQLDGNKSSQALASFEGLKVRYKNKIKEARNQLQNIVTEKEAITAQLAESNKYAENAKKYEEATAKATQLENENKTLKEENQTNKHFRRRYDLEGDPEIKSAYIEPMTEAKTSGLDIIKGHDVPTGLWDDLLEADSEFKINSLIENSGITGMNATSLKTHALNYRDLQKELNTASSPEYIETSIQAAKGRSRQISEEKAQKVFSAIKTSFEEIVTELKESPINKEHNFFVYDKVIEKAQNYYNSLRSTLGPDYQNEQIMGVLSQAALMSAAYPSQKQALDYYMREHHKLLKEIADSSGTAPIRQTREQTPKGFSGNLDEIKSAANTNLEDIAKSALSGIR